MKKWLIILYAVVLPMVIRAQEMEIGFRLNGDALVLREYNLASQIYENVWGYDPFVIHTSIALRVNHHVIPELRVGYALIGPYDGWEMGLILKGEVIKNSFYVIACNWYHWNRGGYGGTTSSTYETLFNAPGIGVGLYTGTHSSLELMFLKPFGGDLGYTLIFGTTPPEKNQRRCFGSSV